MFNPQKVQKLNKMLIVKQLIQEVKSRQPIWNRKHDLHHERGVIEALWEEIGIVLGKTRKF